MKYVIHASLDSANSLASVAFTGGLTNAAAHASGQPGILSYNNVTFNVSTGTCSKLIPESGG